MSGLRTNRIREKCQLHDQMPQSLLSSTTALTAAFLHVLGVVLQQHSYFPPCFSDARYTVSASAFTSISPSFTFTSHTFFISQTVDLFQGLSALFLPPMYLNIIQTVKFQPLALTYCLPPWTDDPGMKQYRLFFWKQRLKQFGFFTGIVWIFLSDYCERKGSVVGLHRGEVKCRASAQQSLVGDSEEYSV